MKIFRWVLATIVVGLFCAAGYWVYSVYSFISLFPQATYNKEDLVNNYELKKRQIEELRVFINQIVPAEKSVNIEFEGDSIIYIFHVGTNGSIGRNWNVPIVSGKTDTLLTTLGWNHETLKTLKRKLADANCISVENGEPVRIGYQRSGMGKYYYLAFDQPLPDSVRKKYDDGCTYIFYKDNMVLEYGGGAIGPQCFETFERK